MRNDPQERSSSSRPARPRRARGPVAGLLLPALAALILSAAPGCPGPDEAAGGPFHCLLPALSGPTGARPPHCASTWRRTGGSGFDLADTDGDGTPEIVGRQAVCGTCHADVVATLRQVFGWDPAGGRFVRRGAELYTADHPAARLEPVAAARTTGQRPPSIIRDRKRPVAGERRRASNRIDSSQSTAVAMVIVVVVTIRVRVVRVDSPVAI